uniref:RNA-binding protein 44 isoform X2 n=1 Tax=Monopterus albus TaxID=43700 RepID=UPI0009B3343D|nr:RNA-binding protein 44 isoform X2 [Monopterus albus]
MPHTYLEQGKLVNNGTDNFIMPGCRNSRDGPQLREELCQNFHTAPNSPRTQEPAYHNAHRGLPLSQLNKESSAWQVASSAAVCRDPAALASFCPDMELERCRQEERGNPELTSYRSERPYTGNKSPPEYCSFYSTHMDATEYNDRSDVQSESDLLDCTFSPVEMSNTKEGCQDDMVYANEHTVYNAEASLSLEDESDNFHSIMEDDKSILVCLPSNGVKAHNSEIQSGPVTTDGETLAAKMNTAEKYTSPMSCVPVCDIMVGTELVPCASVSTQTDDPETVDKHIVTEVHMADLDYLTGELIKLKKVQEELREKEKMKSSGCRLRKGCDCVQRAQRAELCLLALQYSMCRQHCWRLYYASAEADQLTPVCGDAYQNRPMDHPANMLSVLKKLDSDYNGMREKILQGVPLEHLNPLSVDSWKITIAASYIPAQIIGDVRGSVSSWSSKEPQKDRTEKSSGCPDNESTKGCQRKAKQAKENSDPRRAVTCVPQAACKELDISEVWYDAVEDVEPERAETGPDLNVRTYERTTDQDKTSALCVSSVPSNAMELITCSPSIKNRKMVCISPTAKGTCVPQHYGTMGGFDTLMAELTKHHPDVGRQRIVDALVELRAKHHGILSSLPLRTIREMMSELLTRQASSSQL